MVRRAARASRAVAQACRQRLHARTLAHSRQQKLHAHTRTIVLALRIQAHYHSEFHKYNLKRKVAGLGPITRAAFEEREARASTEAAAAEAGRRLTTAERRMARDERRQKKHEKQLANPHSKAAHYQATETMNVEQYVRHQMARAPTFDAGTDLFSRHQCEGATESEKLHANLEHMGKTHGFYVPYLDYCTDLAGMIKYLQEKVYIGNVALESGKQFHSVEAVQVLTTQRRK